MALAATRPTELSPMTVDDLHALPDDGNRYELIGGEIVMTPAPAEKHQRVSNRLAFAFTAATRDLGMVYTAPFDLYLSLHNVVQPDLLFVSKERMEIVDVDGVHGAPDIVVEITSPSTRRQDLVRKAALYADHGVLEYWIVDSELEFITVKLLSDGRYLDQPNEGGVARSRVLPTLEIEIAALFAAPSWMKHGG